MAQAKEGEGLREDGLSSSAGASRINFISIENLNLFLCKCLFDCIHYCADAVRSTHASASMSSSFRLCLLSLVRVPDLVNI